jgi:hypothetical protein
MMGRDDRDGTFAALLGAYRAAACAEADSHFDERALETQRQRILARLEQAGQPARVLAFPGAPVSTRQANHISRRWISAAAVAGLVIGLVTGQLLHVMPGDAWVHRDVGRRPAAAASADGMVAVPAVATSSIDDDNALLDAVDRAVNRRGASDLWALDDLTYAYEPR